MKAIWERDDTSFILVEETVRLLTPFLNIFMAYAAEDTYYSVTSWI